MKYSPFRNARLALLAGCAAIALSPQFAAAQEAAVAFDIPAQDLDGALTRFAQQSEREIIMSAELTRNRRAPAVHGALTPEAALSALLAGTGLSYRVSAAGSIVVEVAQDPQGGSAGDVDALIVTAQKREENIQDVPIAISAFSQEDLTNRQVAGGPDLITQIPNFSFTKTNFSSYSIQIRGIGTQAISATTDPAVAVAFNNTPFIRNRFFEQEFYDLERLEVLRGPQGTLYGRNATAGVVNLISAKPKFTYDARVSADLGNYSSTRVEGMVNIPLVEDAVALRVAGAWTKRDGYATNQLTGAQIDGRDLWSTRVSLRFEPTDWISANLIYEHFQEDDDRLRSGKQLCKKHVVPSVGGIPVPTNNGGSTFSAGAYLGQGCLPVSLYSPEAFQTPNGFTLPYFGPTQNLGNPVAFQDPYLNATQSRDLRVIKSSVEPDYRASTDLVELQTAIDLTDSLTLNSETAYNADFLWSLQDFNRFTTSPGAFRQGTPNRLSLINADGEFCDPQLGCSDRLLLVDLSTAKSTQFSQEFRLGSDFDGPFNFSLGANFLRHDAEDKYYVFINSITMLAAFDPWIPGVTDNRKCQGGRGAIGETAPALATNINYNLPLGPCIYVDPNPIGQLNDQGRNYFLSRNPYRLISYAAFGEVYYNLTADLKLTGGLRFTVDKKRAPQIPSWLLAAKNSLTPTVAGPYPVAQILDQEWNEPTGRLALDWKPDLPFTDDTLLYASYAHGYKAGGANPPPPILVTYSLAEGAVIPNEALPDTFEPEFVDAFEVGTKNTLLGGALTLNLTGFYYDYKGYQTSEIRNRSAVNSNYDAEVWGAELEADWRVTEALRLGVKGGYNMTRIGDGQKAIDLMDRTAGHDDWVVVRPFPTIPSNCILPVYVVTAGGMLNVTPSFHNLSPSGICVDAYYSHLDPIPGLPYNPNDHTNPGGYAQPASYAGYQGFDPTAYPEINGGQGFKKDLSGNELPNAPNYTATVTADYTLPLAGDWLLNLHGDYHYQGESWARVFNSDPYDRIEAFSTVNVSAIFTNDDAGWKVMAYVKNVFDETAITGAFLNSDDTGLTTNVFLTEPRLYGVRVTKDWTGLDGFWGFGDGGRRPAGEPYPLTVEMAGGVGRISGDTESYTPAWLDKYSAAFPLPSIDDEQLNWGDMREVKLTYAPSKDWRGSASYRFGRTSGANRGAGYEHVSGGSVAYTFYRGTPFARYTNVYIPSPDNHWRGALHDAEEYAIVDFMVGKEIGVGGWLEEGRSVVSVGVRYADLDSTSSIIMDGVPDRYVIPFFNRDTTPGAVPNHRSHYTTSLDSKRGFEGVGPAVSWEASKRLLGSDDLGHVDLDWSVAGGVLFGKQTAQSSEERWGLRYLGYTSTPIYDNVVPRQRGEKVTVPNLSLSLGLSYTIDRVKVSTGYSYDRFFDAVDGGYKDAEQYDRTIHGPFMKLSVGFGG